MNKKKFDLNAFETAYNNLALGKESLDFMRKKLKFDIECANKTIKNVEDIISYYKKIKESKDYEETYSPEARIQHSKKLKRLEEYCMGFKERMLHEDYFDLR